MKQDLITFDDGNYQFDALKTPQKIKLGVKTRLELMSPYIDKWPQAMALGLKP